MKSDSPVVVAWLADEILRRDVYALRPYPPGRFRVVLDVGANIGMFSVYARCLQPEATVVALEPAADTFEVLRANVAALGVTCVQAALGDGRDVLLERGDTSVAARTRGAAGGSGAGEVARSLTLAEVLEYYCREEPAACFLKIDCEGGESVLLDDASAERALAGVGHAAVEIHHPPGEAFRDCPPLERYLNFFEGLRWTHDVEYRDVRREARVVVLRRR